MAKILKDGSVILRDGAVIPSGVYSLSGSIHSLKKEVVRILMDQPLLDFSEDSYKKISPTDSGIYLIVDSEGIPGYGGSALGIRSRIRRHGKIYRTFGKGPNLTSFQKYVVQLHFAMKGLLSGEQIEILRKVDGTLERLFGDLVLTYKFRVLPCPPEDKFIMEQLLLAELEPYINHA